MSHVYDALKKLEAERAAPTGRTAALDAIRVQQFVDLQRELLLAAGQSDDLPDRLVHGVATFLGVPGAALGLVQGQSYRLLATYGAGYEDRSRHDRAALGECDLAPALTRGHPVVRQHRVDGETIMREVVVPFNGEVTGALHLAFPEGASVPEEKVSLARVLAGLVGIALANARTSSDRLR